MPSRPPGYLISAKVYQTGRTWHERWQDGQPGIFKVEDSLDTTVSKKAEMNDPELEIGMHVLEALYKRTAKDLCAADFGFKIEDANVNASEMPALEDVSLVEAKDPNQDLLDSFLGGAKSIGKSSNMSGGSKPRKIVGGGSGSSGIDSI